MNNRIDQLRVRIIDHPSDNNYVVLNLPPHETLSNNPYPFLVCHTISDPDWEVGSIWDITFYDEGSCHDFSDLRNTGFEPVLEEVSTR